MSGWLQGRWNKVTATLLHAFALSPPAPLSAEDRAFLTRIADALLSRGLDVPARLFCESLVPMNFVGSQILHGLSPLTALLPQGPDLDRLARILEERESVAVFVQILEERLLLRERAPRAG